MTIQTANLTDAEFVHLCGAGFFSPVLKHPEIELWKAGDGIFYVWFPGVGAVGLHPKEQDKTSGVKHDEQ